MTREEHLNQLGVRPLEWRFGVRGGFVQHEAYTCDPYEKDILLYKIEVNNKESEDYYAYLILDSRAGKRLLAKELSLDASAVRKMKEKAEDDFYNRIVRGAVESERRAKILKDEKEEQERYALECAKRLLKILLSETTNKEKQ